MDENEQLVTTQETPVSTQVPTAPEPVPEGMVNQAPELTPELRAEVERLAQQKAQKLKQEEFDEITRQSQEKAIYWRRQKAESRADYFKSPIQEQQPIAPVPDLGMPEPKKEDFDDYDKYNEAKINYEVSKKLAIWDQERARKESEHSFQNKMQTFKQKLDEGFKKYPDFEEVALDKTVPVNPVMAEILADSERPEDLAYWLGKNRTEAFQISRMTPIQAAKKIRDIELELSKEGGNNLPKPKIPGAPPPIRPLGATHTVEKSLENMTQAEFESEMERRTGRRF
jgi:hypothetical protein